MADILKGPTPDRWRLALKALPVAIVSVPVTAAIAEMVAANPGTVRLLVKNENGVTAVEWPQRSADGRRWWIGFDWIDGEAPKEKPGLLERWPFAEAEERFRAMASAEQQQGIEREAGRIVAKMKAKMEERSDG